MHHSHLLMQFHLDAKNATHYRMPTILAYTCMQGMQQGIAKMGKANMDTLHA